MPVLATLKIDFPQPSQTCRERFLVLVGEVPPALGRSRGVVCYLSLPSLLLSQQLNKGQTFAGRIFFPSTDNKKTLNHTFQYKQIWMPRSACPADVADRELPLPRRAPALWSAITQL